MSRNAIKIHITNELKRNKAFWSYDLSKNPEIPDELLIEQCLKYGSWESNLLLFDAFPTELIRSTWEREMARQSNFYQLNVFLARIFFAIEDPEVFLQNLKSRYLKELETRDLPTNL